MQKLAFKELNILSLHHETLVVLQYLQESALEIILLPSPENVKKTC